MRARRIDVDRLSGGGEWALKEVAQKSFDEMPDETMVRHISPSPSKTWSSAQFAHPDAHVLRMTCV
eukprot:4542995-Prymnesium_polylepis.1